MPTRTGRRCGSPRAVTGGGAAILMGSAGQYLVEHGHAHENAVANLFEDA